MADENNRTLEKEMDRIRKQQGCSGPGRLADALKNGENLVESRRRVKGLLFRLLVSTLNPRSRQMSDYFQVRG